MPKVSNYMTGDDWAQPGGITIAPKGGKPIDIPPGAKWGGTQIKKLGTKRVMTKNSKTGKVEYGPEEPLTGRTIKPEEF